MFDWVLNTPLLLSEMFSLKSDGNKMIQTHQFKLLSFVVSKILKVTRKRKLINVSQ